MPHIFKWSCAVRVWDSGLRSRFLISVPANMYGITDRPCPRIEIGRHQCRTFSNRLIRGDNLDQLFLYGTMWEKYRTKIFKHNYSLARRIFNPPPHNILCTYTSTSYNKITQKRITALQWLFRDALPLKNHYLIQTAVSIKISRDQIFFKYWIFMKR